MVDANRKLVAGEVAEHHDHVGAPPVGDNRHDDRDQEEKQSPPERTIGEISVQRSDRDRGDEVAHATAGFDHRPVAARNHQMLSLPVYRNAAEPQSGDGRVGRPLHQLGLGKIAEGNGKEQKQERKGKPARDLPADHGRHGQDQHGDECELCESVDRCHLPQQPAKTHRSQQENGQIARPWAERDEASPYAPDQPQRDGWHDHPMRIGVGAPPDARHVACGLAKEQHDGQ
ncbi:MAG: hypothetical protein AW12_01064 [Candidatus Accumulibacter sp. BA-94]|nr:MAG: hypothetical protein AW12_01064 [Candidatus Accumulibacter sp. BA-94]